MNCKKAVEVKNFILDKDKKNYLLMSKEIFTLWKQDNKFPIHYFTRLAYKKNSPNHNYFTKFTTINNLWNSCELHTEKTVEILENKIKFNNFCTKNNINIPLLLAYNDEIDFTINDSKIRIQSKDSFIQLLRKLITVTEGKSAFLKPANGIQGKGCYRLNINDLDNNEIVDELYAVILSSKYIIQETIEQHPEISNINPYSVNTIRMDTYIRDDNSVEILSGLMRFGRKGSVMDNASSGGFFISLDLEKGTLREYGMQFLDLGNKYIYEHPDTKVKLNGYQIPYVEEAKDLVKKAAILLGDRLVGWDVAITPEGPILIEGNHNYHIGMQEMAYGGYKRHPIFKEILEKHT